MRKLLSAALLLTSSALVYQAEAQTTTNMSWTVTGAAPSGSWENPTGWSNFVTLANGVPWTDTSVGNFARFGYIAGSGSGAYTVTLNQTHTLNGLLQSNATGTLTVAAASGAQIYLPAGSDGFFDSSTGGTYLTAPMTGPGGPHPQFGDGGSANIHFLGSNSYTGGMYFTSSSTLLFYTNGDIFGFGMITNGEANGSYVPLLADTGVGTGIVITNDWTNLISGGGVNFAGNVQAQMKPITLTGNIWLGPNTMNLRNNEYNVTATNILTVEGVISGTGGINLSANNIGVFEFTGQNTFTGPLTIGLSTGSTSASLMAGSDGNLGGAPASLTAAAIALGQTPRQGIILCTNSFSINPNRGITMGMSSTLDAKSGDTLTVGSPVVGAFSLTNAPSGGTIILTNSDNTYSGNTYIPAGTLELSGQGDLGGNGGSTATYAGTITATGSFIYNSSTAQTLSGVISGAGALTQSGTGLLTLTASNTATGTLTITASSGGVQFGNGTTRNGTNSDTISVGGLGLLTYAVGYGSVTNSKAINGAGNVTASGPGDLTFAGSVNAVTGVPALVINGGTVTQGGDGNLGAVPGSFTYNDIVLNSGALRGNNGNSSVTANRGILLTANSGVGALGGDLLNILGVISDGNNGYGITMNATTVSGKTGTVSLQGVNTYTGPTIVTSGVLALANNGSISNSSSLTIAAGGTFDVSNFTNNATYGYFSLSSATSLTASGTGLPVGTNLSTQAAAINGNATNFINLGTQGITLNYNPTNLTGDDLQPPLYIAQGTLVLNGNSITLNCSQTLGYGAYTLIQQASGNISGTVPLYPSGSFSFTNGAVGTLSIVGGAVVLTVAPPASDASSAYFNNWTPYPPTVTYGSTSVTVSGTVSNLNGNVAVTGDTLNVQLQGTATAVPAVIGANGSYTATLTFPGTTKIGYYVITNTYTNTSGSGAGNNFALDTSTALFITPAPLTITANSPTTPYGELVAGYSGAGSTQFVPVGLSNSETIGSVTMTQVMSPVVGGAPAVGTTNSWAGTYTVTPSAATAGTFSAANYTITYVAGTLTITPDALTITAGNGASTYGTTYAYLGAKTTNDSPNAPLFTTTVMSNGQSADSITVTLSSTGGTPTSPAFTYALVPSAAGANSSAVLAYDKTNFNVNNYTIAYANGTLTVNPAPATVTALAQTKTYGSTATAGTVTIPSALVSVSTLSNSDTIGSVSLAYSLSGGYTGDQAGAPVSGSPYTITASGAAGGTGDESNYVFAYVPGALTVNPLPVAVYGTKTFDGTTSVDLSTLVVTNAVGSDVVSVTTGPGTMSGTGPGLETITSFGTATLAGAAAGNYTLLGAIGYVLVNSSSPFVITSSALDSTKTNLVVCWNSISNVSYQVLTNTDLTQTNNWTVLGTITATNTTTCFTVPGTTNADAFVLIKHL